MVSTSSSYLYLVGHTKKTAFNLYTSTSYAMVMKVQTSNMAISWFSLTHSSVANKVSSAIALLDKTSSVFVLVKSYTPSGTSGISDAHYLHELDASGGVNYDMWKMHRKSKLITSTRGGAILEDPNDDFWVLCAQTQAQGSTYDALFMKIDRDPDSDDYMLVVLVKYLNSNNYGYYPSFDIANNGGTTYIYTT